MTLIRSTLSSMPIYCMSLFQMPRSVSLRLERIQIDFIWGGGTLERNLVEWSIVCLDKRKSGLGVRNLAFCGGKGSFMEASYMCKVWGRRGWLEVPCCERQFWGWFVESD